MSSVPRDGSVVSLRLSGAPAMTEARRLVITLDFTDDVDHEVNLQAAVDGVALVAKHHQMTEALFEWKAGTQ